jgi:putative transcriptional regulator
VQLAALSYLHSDNFLPDASVMPNLDLGHSLDTLVELGESFSTTSRVKMFAGYAGWSPGQLEDEMKRGAWLTHPASLDLVFDSDPMKLWKVILRQKGIKYRLMADMPDDVSLN